MIFVLPKFIICSNTFNLLILDKNDAVSMKKVLGTELKNDINLSDELDEVSI